MSFFTSLTGLNAATAQLGVTSNNIANASTVGFKRSRADFGDIFATSPIAKSHIDHRSRCVAQTRDTRVRSGQYELLVQHFGLGHFR